MQFFYQGHLRLSLWFDNPNHAAAWLVMIAVILLLIGMVAWSVFGTVEATSADGSTKEIHPVSLVTN